MIESISKFSALSFFSLSLTCHKYKERKSILSQSKYRLPSLSSLAEEEGFATAYLGWSDEGVTFGCDVKCKEVKLFPSDIRKGDSVEIFLDSRAVKSCGYLTKFCHHFLFFPDMVDGAYGKEITKFSADEIHPLADRESFVVKGQKSSSSYQLEIFLPGSTIYGFDPKSYSRMGFAYRINRFQNLPQVFGGSNDLAKIERNPAFWCETYLVK